MTSTAETSLSSDDMSRLIDRNSRLQKTGRAAEKEAEGLRAQNLEVIHQRDFYQVIIDWEFNQSYYSIYGGTQTS